MACAKALRHERHSTFRDPTAVNTSRHMWVSEGEGRRNRSPFVKGSCAKLRMLEEEEEKGSRKNRKGEKKRKK